MPEQRTVIKTSMDGLGGLGPAGRLPHPVNCPFAVSVLFCLPPCHQPEQEFQMDLIMFFCVIQKVTKQVKREQICSCKSTGETNIDIRHSLNSAHSVRSYILQLNRLCARKSACASCQRDTRYLPIHSHCMYLIEHGELPEAQGLQRLVITQKLISTQCRPRPIYVARRSQG